MFNFLRLKNTIEIERNLVFNDTRYSYMSDGEYSEEIRIYHLYPTSEYEVYKEKYKLNGDGSNGECIYRKFYTVTESTYGLILSKYIKEI